MRADNYLIAPLSGSPVSVTWNPLRLLNLYRLIVAGLFTLLYHIGQIPPPFGSYDTELFYWTAVTWLAAGLLFGLAVRTRVTPFYNQVFVQVFTDIIVVTILMHASGGIRSGLGMLLVISVASGSLLTAGRTAGVFGAAATIALLAEQLYALFWDTGVSVSFPQAGLLGTTLFATAALAHTLAQRIRESEALAEQRSVDLANMAELTRYIVQQVQVGVLAVDRANRVRLMNASAWGLLGRPPPTEQEQPLEKLSPALAQALLFWRNGNWEEKMPLKLGRNVEVTARFSGIGTGQYAGTVIFLEDLTASARQVQQLKLATVGRLTASIAHEIRNPLGAISHAGQLLGESQALAGADRRLVDIILGHSRRVNAIIENILQLSRRERSQPIAIELLPWLERFRDDCALSLGITREAIAIAVLPPHLSVTFDPLHLHQILTNLCKNAIEHTDKTHTPRVTIRAGLLHERAPFIEVVDAGPGVAQEVVPRLFEPFVSTRHGGTGLGLYISRELTECNGAELEYQPQSDGGCFRLNLAEIEKP